MTVFIINQTVEFDSENLTLTHVDDVNTQLPIPAAGARLLTLLIKEKGTPVSKDSILHEVWEKLGYAPSTNNLYHYMSIIRKLLSDLGVKDVITTLPKIGFVMVADIVLKNEKTLDLPMDDKIKPPEFERNLEKKTAKPTIGKYLFKKSMYVLLFITISFFTFYFFSIFDKNIEQNEPMAIINNCHIYSVGKKEKKESDQEVKAILDELSIECSVKANLYYSSKANYIMIYYCKINKNNGTEQDCVNVIKDSEVSL